MRERQCVVPSRWWKRLESFKHAASALHPPPARGGPSCASIWFVRRAVGEPCVFPARRCRGPPGAPLSTGGARRG
eukprot:4750685-Alexandrium_andersonii.AAC.1